MISLWNHTTDFQTLSSLHVLYAVSPQPPSIPGPSSHPKHGSQRGEAFGPFPNIQLQRWEEGEEAARDVFVDYAVTDLNFISGERKKKKKELPQVTLTCWRKC